MNRVASLDGLRGIAILLVLGRHLLNLPQGWMGVDIFFVLSGYLITSILLRERSEPRFWTRFYTRRLTRLVPPYVLLFLLAGLLRHPAWHILWPYLAFLGSNIAVVRNFPLMELAGFGALWSLAIEEQFYLVWPTAIRRISRRALAVTLCVLLLLEPILRTLATLHGASWSFTYMLTPFRLDGLALGSLLALVLSHPSARASLLRVNRVLLPASLLVLVISLPFQINTQYVLFLDLAGYLVVALASASVLAYLVLQPTTLTARILSLRPLAFLGRISYGVYLFHELISHIAIDIATRHGYTHNVRTSCITFPITLLLAWASFHFYESPILAWGKRRLSRSSTVEEERIIRTQEGTTGHSTMAPPASQA